MKTKKQLEQSGWIFIKVSGGAISANKKINGEFIFINSKTLPNLRKKISDFEIEILK